jgi:hypothetical protein
MTVRLPEPLFVGIECAARSSNVPKSEIVRELLDCGKGVKASLWSRMEDLVIHDESLPTDLATNEKHLRQYGRNRSPKVD